VSDRDLSWRDAVRAELAAAGVDVDVDVVLAKRTTFGIGGPADLFAIASDEAQVSAVLRAIAAARVPLFVLGGGSNLLVGDGGIRGVVLSLAGELAKLVISENGKSIEVGAGCTFPRLTKTCLELGWPGAVGWMGTPGQVGGALLMNAGSKWGELGSDVATVIAASAIGTERFDRDQCRFGYRTSVFQERAVRRFDSSVTSADPEVSTLVLTRAILQCDKAATEKAKELDAQAHELLARRHRTQPKLRSAGSLFKNPLGDFAGRLIEASGLKGFTVGQAQVSPVHANFVVNLGGATAADVVAVADHVVATVARDHGVTLEWEVRRVGEHAPLSSRGAP
jgi:UDP-N-acetylmuramate dehydrogenase